MLRSLPFIGLLSLAILAGCATPDTNKPPPRVISMEERLAEVEVTPLPHRKPFRLEPIRPPGPPSFNPAEVTWFNYVGSASISGTATVSEVGYEERNCAGNKVFLIPVSRYATYRIVELYGNDRAGYNPASDGKVNLEKANPQYAAITRNTTCNEFGEFIFTNLHEGEYYVTTYVRWDDASGKHGGNLVRRIEVGRGQDVTTSLSN